MVEDQLIARGIHDSRVIRAMRTIKRHEFVPADMLPEAYNDLPLPIGLGQTISQPYIVAHMSELLRLSPNDIVLEVGTGSGYQAAVLSHLANQVVTVESIPSLANEAEDRLQTMGANNVAVLEGDGGLGAPNYGPYDAIIISAAAPKIPVPLMLQLKIGGRLVAPIGTTNSQTLVLYKKMLGQSTRKNLYPVRFVSLTGKWGAQTAVSLDNK
ncbi:MAG TPA: protein-L-isoaspartate(D-aspartate) O-methyltransferase [Anaerolineales bacterium]|nr:protein-L-isoaspartate(D-aspartate) O-methyltransferase [Anaerolineales bacterium]